MTFPDLNLTKLKKHETFDKSSSLTNVSMSVNPARYTERNVSYLH